jgi:arylsulfatase A-like enzyme
MRALTRTHLDASRTLFVYTSDHGAQWPFGKWNLYDAGIRIPFIAAWPGHLQPASTSDAMICWPDLLPTFIDLGGGSVPEGIDGKSFANVLRGTSTTHREKIFTTHSGDGRMNVDPPRATRTADWTLILNLHPEFAHPTHIDKALARDGGRYWISWFERAKSDSATAALVRRYHERPSVERYDLRSDPFEQRNLGALPAHAGRASELRAQLTAWMKAQDDQETLCNEPRLLADPASTRPGAKAGTDQPATKNKK